MRVGKRSPEGHKRNHWQIGERHPRQVNCRLHPVRRIDKARGQHADNRGHVPFGHDNQRQKGEHKRCLHFTGQPHRRRMAV
ncbi:MAG: Uncharacterised protein [SAR116 cluster bacterium]|nr:MAG: Uncharacterised protein [SAR116 cluster bacterium]